MYAVKTIPSTQIDLFEKKNFGRWIDGTYSYTYTVILTFLRNLFFAVALISVEAIQHLAGEYRRRIAAGYSHGYRRYATLLIVYFIIRKRSRFLWYSVFCFFEADSKMYVGEKGKQREHSVNAVCVSRWRALA